MVNPTTSILPGTAQVRSEPGTEEEISLFAFATLLLTNRWRIIRWTFVGGALAALSVIGKPQFYSASFSFVPQGTDAARSGLASLAGQLGIANSTNLSQSPDFYVGLIRSRALLAPIARDTFLVSEMQGKHIAFPDLFGVPEGPWEERQQAAVKILAKMVNPSVVKASGVVQVSVATRWGSVSHAIAQSVLGGVNNYNIRTRQGQATQERKFIEGRLAIARQDLRASEDRFQSFLSNNRGNLTSPQLVFERDRLQRAMTLQQQVYTALTQAYDDVRIREARDTPSITIVESPEVSTTADPRGRVKRGLLGVVLGLIFGVALSLGSAVLARRQQLGDPVVAAFLRALQDARYDVLKKVMRHSEG